MAFSINKVILVGTIGRDPETRFTTSNSSVTSFSVATDDNYKGKDGNWVKQTDWTNIIAWQLSDYLKDNLKKGGKVYVEGKLKIRSYDDKEGNKKYITEVIADSSKIIPLDAKNNSSGPDFSQADNAALNKDDEINNPLPF